MTVKVTLDLTPEEIDYTFCLGDKISFRLTTGEEVEAIAVQQEDDGMIFCALNCLGQEESMNDTFSNEGGYEASKLRKKLNKEILETFPMDVHSILVPFNNGDYLRIPCIKEVTTFKCRWEPMRDIRNRLAVSRFGSFNPSRYWLQDINEYSSCDFAYVDDSMNLDYADAEYTLGIRLVFKVKDNA